MPLKHKQHLERVQVPKVFRSMHLKKLENLQNCRERDRLKFLLDQIDELLNHFRNSKL
jgi:hypothetical protein